jgi:enoyl-CoA hydratase
MSVPEWETVAVDLPAEGVVRITLNRPEAGNALSSALAADLSAALRWARFESGARAAVVTGSGRFFCAGADLKEKEKPPWWLWDVRAAIDYVEQVEMPVIAAINGTCMGGGLELALAADIRVAGSGVQIGLPEITFGALPAAGGPARLTRLVGPGRAKHLILTGERFTGELAHAYGIAEIVVPDDAVVAAALDLAGRIAQHAGYASRTAKYVIDRGLHLPGSAALALEYAAIDTMADDEERAAAAAAAMARSATYRKLLG